jgi:predicted chitinase
MMLLGGTTEAGAKRFAQLGAAMRQGNVGGELLRLGYSTEQINSGMAGYIKIIGRTGALQGMTTDQIAKSSAGYLKDLDALAKITGQTREEKQKEQEALLKDAQFRAAVSSMDAESQKQMMKYITSFPKEQQAAIKDMIATGNITSEQAIKLNALMPGAAKQAMSFGRTLQQGGKISSDSMNAARNNAIQEARINVKRYKDQGLYNQEMGETYVGMAELAAYEMDELNKATKEAAETTRKSNNAEQLERSKQKLAEFSNYFTNFLANSGLLDVMMKAFEMLADFTINFVIPAFNLLADGITMLGPVFTFLGDAMYTVADVVTDAFYVVSDFIEDNLTPILIGLGSALGTLAIVSIPSVIAALVAKAAAVWAVVAPVLAAAAPFILIAAVVGVAVKIFQKLGGDMKVFQDGLNYLWTGMKTFFSYLKLGFYKVLDALPGVDFSKEIEETDKEIAEQGLEREKLANNMATRMAQNRERNAIEEAKKEAERKTRDDKRAQDRHNRDLRRINDRASREQAIDQKKEDATKKPDSVDLSGPEQMLVSFGRQQNGLIAQQADAVTKQIKLQKDLESAHKDVGDAMSKLASAKNQEERKAAQEALKLAKDRLDTLEKEKKVIESTPPPSAGPGGATSVSPSVPAAPMPALKQDQKANMELITAALKKQGLTDPKYIAATLGNVMKETGGKSISENMNYGGTDNSRIRKIFGSRAAKYSDAELDVIKKDPTKMGEMMYGSGTELGQKMGNTEPGDGFKYRGRGFIQLTGKNNYAAASKAIYGDDRLVKNPDLVNNPAVAAEVSAWYMKKGQTGMAKKLGIDTGNMSQEQANLLATSQIAGSDIRRKGAIGQEIQAKVDRYAQQFTGGQGAQMVASTKAGTGTAPTPPVTETASAKTPPIKVDQKTANDYAWSVFSGKQTMAQVPQGYQSTVSQILQNPPTHWATATAKAPTAGTTMAKAETGKPGSLDTQTQTQTQTATGASGKAGDATVKEKTPAELLTALNSKMEELIAVSKHTAELNDRQLSVQKSLGSSELMVQSS